MLQSVLNLGLGNPLLTALATHGPSSLTDISEKRQVALKIGGPFLFLDRPVTGPLNTTSPPSIHSGPATLLRRHDRDHVGHFDYAVRCYRRRASELLAANVRTSSLSSRSSRRICHRT